MLSEGKLPAKTKKTRTLSESLSAVLKSYGIDKRIQDYDVINHWPQIVGERIAAVTTAVSVSDRVLYVKVRNSSWRTELTFLKSEILAKISEKVERARIDDIRLI